MGKRGGLGNRLRFEVFKRDGFTCMYCGNKPPQIVLEVDHIVPVSKGGTNSIENLVCSCFSCNRGKAANLLGVLPNSAIEENTREKVKQYAEYIKWIKEKAKLDEQAIDFVCAVYETYIEGYTPSERFRKTILDFIQRIGIEDTTKAMQISCSRMKEHHIYKYFCGVCWSMYKQKTGGN